MANLSDFDERDKQILDWAKSHYKTHRDIKPFADESGIKAGVIYHTLKHHSFIKQTETTEYRVMDAYFKFNGSLADVTRETGLTVWIVAKTIENLGYSPKWHEYRESRYVTKMGIDGVGAEAEFKKLVKSAVDMNEDFIENYRDFDFVVNEKTIDIKELGPIKRKGEKRIFYDFKSLGEPHPDFYCLFLCHDREKRIKGSYDILLIPSEVIPIGKSSFSISTSTKSESHQFWYQFQIDPIALPLALGCEL